MRGAIGEKCLGVTGRKWKGLAPSVLPGLTFGLAAGLLAGLVGCRMNGFRARGELASAGGELGTWRSTPIGCSRDPFDGLPPGESKSVVTLIWEDPARNDSDMVRDRDRWTRQDAPLRLELGRGAKGNAGSYIGSLAMVRATGTTRLDGSVCKELSVETSERPGRFEESKPALSGTLRMDCRVKGSRLTGAVRFEGCKY